MHVFNKVKSFYLIQVDIGSILLTFHFCPVILVDKFWCYYASLVATELVFWIYGKKLDEKLFV